MKLTKLEYDALAQLSVEEVDTLEAALNLTEKEVIQILAPLRKANLIDYNGYVTKEGKKCLEQNRPSE